MALRHLRSSGPFVTLNSATTDAEEECSAVVPHGGAQVIVLSGQVSGCGRKSPKVFIGALALLLEGIEHLVESPP